MTTSMDNMERRLRSSSEIKCRSIEKILDAAPKHAESVIQVLDAPTSDCEAVGVLLSLPQGQKRAFVQLLQMASERPEMTTSLQVLAEAYRHSEMRDPIRLYERLAQSFQRAGDQYEKVQQSDPLSEARSRGAAMRKQMLADRGGGIGAEQVGRLLGLTRQAVEARRQAGKLLAYPIEGPRYRYPRWQFDAEDRVLTGLDRVLLALADLSPWSKGKFMTTADLRLNGETPLDRLVAGDIEPVLQAAEAYGEQYAT